MGVVFFFFKQKTAYEMRISDWSSDVCSSDLIELCLAEIDLLIGRQHPHRRLDRPAVDDRSLRVAQFGEDRRHTLFAIGRIDDHPRRREIDRAVGEFDRKSTRLNSSHSCAYRMPSSA